MELGSYKKSANRTIDAFNKRLAKMNGERFAYFLPSLDAQYGPDVNATCGYAYGPGQKPKCTL